MSKGVSRLKVVCLVSAGHFLSHFYMLLVPPLFPFLKEYFDVGYTELSLSITIFSIVTGLTQGPVGFLVDRFGAKKLLFFGIMIESGAFIIVGLIPTYWMLMLMMAVAGAANSVYHPAGYSILNYSIENKNIGRAFSIHTAAGMLGNAVAPITMISIIAVADWKVALIVCGSFGAIVGCLIAVNFKIIDTAISYHSTIERQNAKTGLSLIFSTPILLGVLFFVGISIVEYGVSAFSVVMLTSIHNISVASAAVILSAYLFASPIGVLCGGWIADRITSHHIFGGVCFVVMAFLFFALGEFQLNLEFVAVLFACAGFFSGAVSPSRDMLIRSLAPAKEMGKVFGVVSTGFNIGCIFSPPLFGYILDYYSAEDIFWILGFVSLITVMTVITTGETHKS